MREHARTAAEILVGWATLVLVTAGLVWVIFTVGGSAVQAADEWALRQLHEAAVPWLRSASHDITVLGKPSAMVPLTAFAALAFWGLGRPRDALWIVLSSVGAGSAYLVLLPLFDRSRPQMFVDPSGLSLPSGHVVAVFALMVPSAIAGWRHWGRRSWPLATLAVLLVVLISFTRVYIQFHWVSDVLLALVLSAVWVWWLDRTLPRHGR